MFGADLFGDLLFATVNDAKELFAGPVWVEQCVTDDQWQVPAAVAASWANQAVQTGEWSVAEIEEHMIVRCD